MSDYEDRRDELDALKKLGPAFVHAQLGSIIDRAHDLREAEHMSFDEALHIASGKSRRAYGTRSPAEF